MPIHKKVKLEIEIEIPETRVDFDPSRWLGAREHVRILKMEKLEVTDIVIAAKVNEKQRAFNEYKRIIAAALEKTQFNKIVKLRNYGKRTISVMVPGSFTRLTPAINFICENTTITHSEWTTDTSQYPPKSVEHTSKFELGKPTVIDELGTFIDNRLLEYKKHSPGVKW